MCCSDVSTAIILPHTDIRASILLLFVLLFQGCTDDTSEHNPSTLSRSGEKTPSNRVTIRDLTGLSATVGKTPPENNTATPPRKSHSPSVRKQKTGTNAGKDTSIIGKYEKIHAAHASGTADTRHTPSGRGFRRPFSPGSGKTETGGGITIRNQKKRSNTSAHKINNIRIPVTLRFAIRSGNSGEVIARIRKAVENIPAGTLFYGKPRFSNKRVYVDFSQMRINGETKKVNGIAVTGRDPGIPASVTPVSDNTGHDIRSKAAKIGGKVADSVVSGLTGGVTRGAVDTSTESYREREQAQKKRMEYHVQAGMPFYIYIK